VQQVASPVFPPYFLGEFRMIELDNGPVALSLVISLAFLAPIFYSFFVDRNEKK
jgi:hypothetical protein